MKDIETALTNSRFNILQFGVMTAIFSTLDWGVMVGAEERISPYLAFGLTAATAATAGATGYFHARARCLEAVRQDLAQEAEMAPSPIASEYASIDGLRADQV